MEIDSAKLEELRSKYRRVFPFVFNEYAMVFRAPSRPEVRAWKAGAADPTRKADADEDIVRGCVVWCNNVDSPDAAVREEFLKVLDTYPLLPNNVAIQTQIQKWTGLVADDSGK